MKQQTQTKKLKEVAEIKSGFAFKSSEFSKQGIPIIRISNITNGEEVEVLKENQPHYNAEIDEKIKNYLIKELDILIALSGATTGKIGIYKQNKQALLNQRIALIRSKNEESKKFIYYFLQTKSQQILKDAYGGAQPNISPKTIENYEIFFPDNKEQTLIVQEIEKQFTRLDASVKSLKSVKKKLEVYRKALLKKAFEKKESWEEKKISEVFYINPSKSEIKDLDENIEVSFIPMAYVSEKGKIKRMDKRKLIEVKKGFTYFKDKDVLLAKITPCFENGKKAIAENLINGVGFGTTEFYVFREMGDVIPEWIYYNLSRDDFRSGAKRSMGGAVGQQRVSKDFIERFNLSFPKTKEEQIQIVQEIESKFSVIDKIEQVVNESLEKSEKLRKSILKSAFEGKLVKMEEVEE